MTVAVDEGFRLDVDDLNRAIVDDVRELRARLELRMARERAAEVGVDDRIDRGVQPGDAQVGDRADLADRKSVV